MDSGHAYVVLPYAIIRYSTDISAYSLITHICYSIHARLRMKEAPTYYFQCVFYIFESNLS